MIRSIYHMFSKGLLLMVAFVIATAGMAQDDLLKKADRSFDDLSYAQAVKQYEKAFENGATDVSAQRRLADSYRKLRDFKNAVKWYGRVCTAPNARMVDLYRYAEALRANGRYGEADVWLDLYGRQSTSDSRVARLAGAADMVPLLLTDPIFEGKAAPVNGNSPFSDMAPVRLGDRLVFASARLLDGTQRKYTWDNTPFLDLYQAVIGADGKLGTITPFSPDLNTRYHESDPTFSTDGNEVYFTRNNYFQGRTVEAEDGVNNLQIYHALFKDGKWVDQEPFAYDSEDYSTGHPSLSSDGKKLFFTSNMPGGFGGTDIYVSEKRQDGSWAAPRNLGPWINTEGDEMFPRAYGKRTLFFASDGQQGLGGLDVFMTDLGSDTSHQVINLGVPINSTEDDISIALDPDGSGGYFTSARPGGTGMDDLYAFKLDHPFKEQVTMRGRVLDKVGRLAVRGVEVSILDASGRELRRAVTDDKGEYEITMVPQKATLRSHFADGPVVLVPIEAELFEMENAMFPDMEVDVLKKWEFIGDASTISGSDGNEPKDLALRPIVTFRGKVIDKMDGKPLNGITVNVLDAQGRLLRTAVTDKRGEYEVTMPQRPYSLKAGFDDGQPVTVNMDPDLYHAADPVLPTIELGLDAKAGLWGHVVDALTGAPVEGVDVMISDLRSGGTAVLQGRTDERGSLPALIPDRSIAELSGRDVFITRNGYFPKVLRLSNVKGDDAVHTITREMQIVLEPVREGVDIRKALDMDPIYFDYKRSDIRSDAEDVLEMVAFMMNNMSGMEIELAAHTDCRANAEYNLALSQARANSARDYLVERGVPSERIKAVGYGESHLVNGCADGVDCNEEQHQMNRRTEFIVTKIK